ncbi:MAG: PP2C family protein-serine/threonine phosphatase [Ignavibacteria bacterium]
MEISVSYEKYLDYPPDIAYALNCDERNLVIARRFLLGLSILYFGAVIYYALKKPLSFDFWTTLTILLIFVSLRIFHSRIFSVKNIRKYLFIFLTVSLVISTTLKTIDELKNIPQQQTPSTLKTEKKTDSDITIQIDGEKKGSVGDVVFTFSLVLLFFRFSKVELSQLYALIFGIPTLSNLLILNNFNLWINIINVVTAAIFYIIAHTTATKRQKNFLSQLTYLEKKNTESRRMKQELDYAREIQLSMLPPNEAVIDNYEIAGISVPTYEVGGDYYDYFKISDSKFGVFICDVSGHGVASALLLSGLRSCLHLVLEETFEPAEIFIKLNKMIRKTQQRKMFVSAILAVIDTKSHTCKLLNAGHLPPYKISYDNSELIKLNKHTITLGALDIENSTFLEDQIIKFDFKNNDKLILYTDGVTEAMNPYYDEYGFERLEQFLFSHANEPTSRLLNNLINSINNFTSDTEQKDDLSILIVSCK